MKNILLLLALVYCSTVINAQPKYRVISIPVESNGKKLRLAWSGGLDSPQFSPFDIDRDGKTDLFVFDRAGNKPLVFLNNGGTGDSAFVYAPQYESVFPDSASDWMLLRDYNGDSIPDIFTHDPLGTRVYKGSLVNDVLHFDLVCPLVRYDDGPFKVNIWTNIADIPVLMDVNRDGDIDVLSYSIFGTSVEYYENQAMEHAGNPAYSVDSFRYLRITSCWGQFTQSSLTNSLNLHDNTCVGFMPAGPQQTDASRHTGNSLYAFDADNDHDIDLLNGNVGYSNLVYLHNCGDSINADVCSWDSLFSKCSVPVDVLGYPAAFGYDVDGDNYEDVLVTPNVYSGQGFNVHNVLLYHNTNEPGCQFEYVEDSFMVHEMIDLGSSSKPVFFDYNGDGLQDIIAGNNGYFQRASVPVSALAYFQNTGTSTNPKYRLMSADIDSLSKFLLTGMHPAFGDLDGDGHEDMLLGETNGFVHFFKNTAVTGAAFPSLTNPQYFTMKVNQYSAPFIYDVNGDSLNDVLIGSTNGQIAYYWNFGTKTSPVFSADSVNEFFGGVDVTPYGYSLGYSAPAITKAADGQMKLLVGSAGGTISAYHLDPAKTRSGTFTLLSSDYLQQRLGLNANISVADINSDGLLEYICGTSLGGLYMLSDSLWDSSAAPIAVVMPVVKEDQLRVYPNPAKDYITCAIANGQFTKPQVEVYNIVGERMPVEVATGVNRVTLKLINPANGFYFIRLTDQGRSYTGKVLIQQ